MTRTAFLSGAILFSMVIFHPIPSSSQEETPLRAQVGRAVRHDTSPALRDLPQVRPQPGAPDRMIPNKVLPDLAQRHKGGSKLPDPVRQSEARPTSGASTTPAPTFSFEGLSDDDNAAVIGGRVVPPDTEGDVGKNHYVQMVNLIFAVYDKTGTKVGGPFASNVIWNGFGGICAAENDGDPVVLYDHLAERWMFSQFALVISGGRISDSHTCIAVSTTSDPLGTYNRYDFHVSPGSFDDYPKLGVWPDGYYLSANEFSGSSGSFQGAIAVAFQRDKILAGDPQAGFVKFGPLPCGNECFFSLQPSHLEGPAPASGTPNTFVMAFDDQTWGTGTKPDGYRLWDFSVNWSAPGSSTFSALIQVDTADFDANLCNFSSSCIPQPPPGERLDSLGQFTMFRAQFRSFSNHNSIVLNHTVDANGRNQAGVRWAELRKDTGGWFLNQTGTYSPDGDNRWMGSAAMDSAGNIALGYSVSSSNTFPSIRYTSRTPSDSPGQMAGGEVELIAGTGAQQSSSNRWGDYSAMSVDPVDGCTFWYTQEYYANNGSFDFKTRIGAFALPSCSGSGCTPTGSTETLCSDGIDNDCDGLIDAADPDCAPACTLGQHGDACVSNAQCCSNKCTGKPGHKTCK